MSEAIKKVKKKKVSIADLQVKPKRLTLVHPDESIDVGDAWVELAHPETSLEYMLVVLQYHNKDLKEVSLTDQMTLQINMIAALIKDWNEEAFGIEYSKEAVVMLLSNPINFWMKDQIQSVVNSESNFFHKP